MIASHPRHVPVAAAAFAAACTWGDCRAAAGAEAAAAVRIAAEAVAADAERYRMSGDRAVRNILFFQIFLSCNQNSINMAVPILSWKRGWQSSLLIIDSSSDPRQVCGIHTHTPATAAWAADSRRATDRSRP